MHITEGIITGTSAVVYTAVGIALVGYGTSRMNKFVVANPEKRPLLGMAGALIFFFSLIPIPAFTGTCSHPCATPLIAILFGPAIAIALTGGTLLFQAAFFAHGGFGTWGANVVALGLFGSLFGWGAFHLAKKMGFPLWVAGCAGGLLGDVMVYIGSGTILAWELTNAPTPQYSFLGYLSVIFAAYLPTQLPIAIGEMIITGLALQYIHRQRPEVLADLGLIPRISPHDEKTHAIALASILCAGFLFAMQPHDFLAVEPQPSSKMMEIPSQKPAQPPSASFSGMDEAVNEKLAENAGRPPSAPFVNIHANGDLGNALLLIAGGLCGFVIGRGWHFISKNRNVC